MRGLDGRTVALLESRRGTELATLVRQFGGTPVSAPSVQEIERPDDIARFAHGLAAARFDLVVFLTGAGVQAVLHDAERRGCLDGTVVALGRISLACRGPKPLATLRRHGLRPQVTTSKPHTSDDLLEALTQLDLDGRALALVHYGERNPSLSESLQRRGAKVEDICAYEWMLPDDVGPLLTVIDEVVARRVDALLVTSQIQYRHLLDVARGASREDALAGALSCDVVVGAIGPICGDAIRRSGIVPDVMPGAANLPAFVRALSDYFELVRG